jgi:hypothetical protein
MKEKSKMPSEQVTCTISTRNRYNTTLPLVLLSIAQQTVSPRYLIIYDDGEHKDLRQDPTYTHLFHLLQDHGVFWRVIYSKQLGQVNNHQHALYDSKTPWVWRVDDDEVPDPNTLETLVRYTDDKTLGAVACAVRQPGDVLPQGERASTLASISTLPNVQWGQVNKDTDVEHLYSSFLYRREAAWHGYCEELSVVGHREETLFSYEMFLKGWKLLVVPNTTVWHLRCPTGGIRQGFGKEHWDKDELVFQRRLNQLHEQYLTNKFYAVLDSGVGDHFMFKTLLPEVRKKHAGKKLIVASCYPHVFDDELDVELISIDEAKKRLGNIDPFTPYKIGARTGYGCHLIDLYKKVYGL